MAKKPKPTCVEVDLAPCASHGYWFVQIRGIPSATGSVGEDIHICGNALPREMAEELKERVEKALRAYPEPYITTDRDRGTDDTLWTHLLKV